MKKIVKITKNSGTKKIFLTSIVGGIGWAFGASIGFALLITLITYILNLLGGLPFVGKFFGQIIESTSIYLNTGLK